MRRVLCREGREDFGNFIEAGAIKWEDKPYSLCGPGDNWAQEAPVGVVENIRREDDGRITGEVGNLHPDAYLLLENKDVGVTIYANELIDRRENGVRIIKSATLKACFLDVDVPWKDEECD